MSTKRSNANNLIVCRTSTKKKRRNRFPSLAYSCHVDSQSSLQTPTAPQPPDSSDDSNKPSILKALEAVVAAGRRGLLGPAAMAAVEAMPDLNLEPSPIPAVKKKKRGKKIVNKERDTVLVVMPPVEGVGSQQPRKEIWICGNSVITTSKRRAKNSSFGLQLGFPSSAAFVYWQGIPAMMWDKLLPFLHRMYHCRVSPYVIVIHFGERDLFSDRRDSLVTRMKNDLGILRRAFPDIVIIWSSLLPKYSWTQYLKAQVIENKRNEVNSKMEKYCNDTGIFYLSHTSIVAENQCLFEPDNTLSNAGADIFIHDLKLALNLVLNKS